MGFSGGSVVKNLPVMQETWVQSVDQEGPFEKEMETRLWNSMDRGAWRATVHGVTKELGTTSK